MTLYDDMVNKDVKRNPVFTAIENLKSPDDIRQFALEYEEYFVKNTNDSIRGKEREVARSNIGYILGYYSDDTRKLWYANLPQVAHPVFGYGFGRN